MLSWNVLFLDEDRFELLNGESTIITFSKKANPVYDSKDEFVSKLMCDMENAEVPISYTKNVKEILFTRMTKCIGDHSDGRIRISTIEQGLRNAAKILTHELAHHVDLIEGIDQDYKMIKEKIKKSKFMPDCYSRKDVEEYWACGAEVFYFGDEKAKRKLRKMNPYLFKTITAIHQKFSKIT